MPTKRLGRPPLPAKARKSARYTFRLDARGDRQLRALTRYLGADESEVMRRALDALARECGLGGS